MFILVLYLALVWIAVWKYRRRWQSAIVLLMAPVPLLVATSILSVLSRSPDAAILADNFFLQNLIGFGSVLHLVSAAYIGIMWLVGGIIAVAKPSSSRVPCNRCGYDLAGTHELICPECGGRLSLCVQELRMQVYMADRERREAEAREDAGRFSDAQTDGATRSTAHASARGKTLPAHLNAGQPGDLSGSRV